MLRPYLHNVITLYSSCLQPGGFLHRDKQGVERTRPPGLVA